MCLCICAWLRACAHHVFYDASVLKISLLARVSAMHWCRTLPLELICLSVGAHHAVCGPTRDSLPRVHASSVYVHQADGTVSHDACATSVDAHHADQVIPSRRPYEISMPFDPIDSCELWDPGRSCQYHASLNIDWGRATCLSVGAHHAGYGTTVDSLLWASATSAYAHQTDGNVSRDVCAKKLIKPSVEGSFNIYGPEGPDEPTIRGGDSKVRYTCIALRLCWQQSYDNDVEIFSHSPIRLCV